MALADLPLLRNYVNQFTKSLGAQVNFLPDSGGDTILHLALLMDYDVGRPAIDPDDPEQYELRTIRKALSKESTKSLRIKTEILHLLVQKAGADPKVQNHHKISAFDIIKSCVKESNEMQKVIKGTS